MITVRKLKRLIVLCLACSLLMGCYNITTNVSDNAKLWGQYEFGKEYILLIDVFLRKDVGSKKKDLALVPPGAFEGEPGRSRLLIAPSTVQDYQSDPMKATSAIGEDKIVGIIKAGTIIRCALLQKHEGASLWFGSYKTLSPYAEIVNGEFVGKMVNIHDLSITSEEINGVYTYRPDKTILRKISK